jgi:hypothetical protein
MRELGDPCAVCGVQMERHSMHRTHLGNRLCAVHGRRWFTSGMSSGKTEAAWIDLEQAALDGVAA